MGKGTTVHIDEPVHDVFDFLVHLHDKEWRRNVVDLRLTADAYDHVGSTHVEVRSMGKRTIETDAVVVAYEPDRIFAIERASGPVRPRVTYEVAEAAGGGTELRFGFSVSQLRGAAKALRPLAWLICPIVERQMRVDLDQMRQALERNGVH
jgi:hypothetical protein